jgi:ATP-dependent exoDNAse (exonuclease V) beta subunit
VNPQCGRSAATHPVDGFAVTLHELPDLPSRFSRKKASRSSQAWLEWQSVHLLAAYDGNFPADLAAGTSDSIAEERRLMYVALTRARRSLSIYVPRRYHRRRDAMTATATGRRRGS